MFSLSQNSPNEHKYNIIVLVLQWYRILGILRLDLVKQSRLFYTQVLRKLRQNLNVFWFGFFFFFPPIFKTSLSQGLGVKTGELRWMVTGLICHTSGRDIVEEIHIFKVQQPNLKDVTNIYILHTCNHSIQKAESGELRLRSVSITQS